MGAARPAGVRLLERRLPEPGVGFGNLAPSWIATIDLRTGAMHDLSDRGAINHAPR